MTEPAPAPAPRRRFLVYGVLPALTLILALAAGWLKWQAGTTGTSEIARAQSIQAATDSAIAMLSYKPDTVERDLTAARDHLTGEFRDSYGVLIHDVVIPGAKQKSISAVATVPAASAMSVTRDRAVVLLFVDQVTTVGTDAPTATASSVQVTLDRVDDRWLVSDFTPL